MPEVMIHVASTCSLKCPTCAYQFLGKDKLKEYASARVPIDEFEDRVDKLVEFGFDRINLTSIIGEPLQITDFLKYAEYLQNHEGIKSFTFFTSLSTRNKSLVYKLLLMDKLKLVISVSGCTEDMWCKNTGVGKAYWENHYEFLMFIMCNISNVECKIDFFIRYPEFFNKKDNDLERKIKVVDNLSGFNVVPFHHNGNWGGLVPDEITQECKGWIKRSEKKGVCGYVLNENTILPDGRVLLCGAIDVQQQTSIGNINDQSLDEIYSPNGTYASIISNQRSNVYSGVCEGCSEHHPIDKNIFNDLKQLLPWIES